MLDVFFWISIFVVALVILVKASDYFTDIAERIGLSLGFSPFIIGVTIVALGTSLPELISSIIAIVEGSSEIVIGNVVGSNIANILLILGITAIIAKHLTVARELTKVDLPILVGSAFLLGFMILDGSFTFLEGLLCLALLVVYILYTTTSQKRSDKEIKEEFKTEAKELKSDLKRTPRLWHNILLLIASGAFVFLGAKYTIDSVVALASVFSTSTNIISLTAFAIGTSLPELSVSIAAAKKNKAEIAVGNILGSNIFNTLGVMGVASLVGVITIPQNILLFSYPVMIVATFLYLHIIQDKQISLWEGWLLIIFYVFFLFKTLHLL